ncbi:L-serine dehydratase/L-threonine deaminase-like [Anneissia japonica]|uniref:L-serine dehydratase/L-threonine deaminase-like n=1 Tax=Anneissia japonica TaxID=1529436 RepID=UPI001425B617|nr:L-serine dehydratase/L-threonine deaminase-like [Anneissia japonica]
MSDQKQLYVRTPLIESTPLSKHASFKVYLKLENTQPAGSFKIRGISNLCKKAIQKGCRHIVSSSGGNAGLAAAYAARQLGVKATVVIPESTPEFVAQKLRDENATVEYHGRVWDEANRRALEIASQPDATIIHPFDNPDIWEGHASMIEEIADDIPLKPDVVFTVVGGGGLLCGVIQGLKRVRWNDVPVIAIETVGADCFNAAVNKGKLVTLPDITSVAKSLGALTVCQQAFDYHSEHEIHSVVVPDKDAVEACLRFTDDHRILVEPACGAALAGIYSDIVPKLQQQSKLRGAIQSAVVIVCGGCSITFEHLNKYKQQFGL